MDAMQKTLTDAIQMFHERMSSFESDLKNSPATASAPSIATEFNLFKTFVLDMLGNLQHQLELLSHNVDNLEQRSRREMLLVHGMAEQPKEDLTKVVVEMAQKHLNLPDFHIGNIKRCHRMGRITPSGKPRPILVKFFDVETRDGIWFAKTSLKGTGITVSEFLTRSRHQVFMAAREKFGVSKCWTRDGYIYVISPNGTRHKIVSAMDLQKIDKSDVPVAPVAAKHPAMKTRRNAATKK